MKQARQNLTPAQVQWIKHPTGDVYTTKVERAGKTFYGGAWLPKAFAERMGMTTFTVEAR